MPEGDAVDADSAPHSEASIPTGRMSPDYAILVDGEPVHERDAGGIEEGYVSADVEIDGDDAVLTVSYDPDVGIKAVSLRWLDSDLTAELDHVDEERESGHRFELNQLGFEMDVEIVPETEVEG